MKQLILFTSCILCGFVALAQTETSPNIAKSGFLTNMTGKTMQAYPNPATDQVTIQHVSSSQKAVISVLNTDGKVLQQQNVVPNSLQTQLRIGLLAKGIYLLRYDDSKGDVRTLRLVKN